ncbi:DedA family protein [Raineyella fluvialis]|uniref:DedA family protein n=1 Tax=Raineyella fluvialis TaxID=2662261 RepID=A0A5Q2FB95_9ACTN|nr:DedA family protein [Raineyella fluvialis]QGF24310.1 DedA family protein [Raineyella fluvialis]
MGTRIIGWITGLMDSVGGPGVFLAILLENVFPPIPSEVILPLAGFTAARPDAPYGVVEAILWATAGSLLGAVLLYGLGAAIGADRLRRIAERMPLVDARDVDASIDWFTRYGSIAVLVGRLVPGVRSLISIPAGIDRMPPLTFGAFTLLGSLLWNSALVVAGYLLGDNWHVVTDWMDRFSTVAYVLLALGLIGVTVWLIRRSVRRRSAPGAAQRPQDSPEETPESR